MIKTKIVGPVIKTTCKLMLKYSTVEVYGKPYGFEVGRIQSLCCNRCENVSMIRLHRVKVMIYKKKKYCFLNGLE